MLHDASETLKNNPSIITKAWREAKNEYFRGRNIELGIPIATYGEVSKKRDKISNHIKALKNGVTDFPEEALDWNTNKINPYCIYSCRKCFYKVDAEVKAIFFEEISLIIHFELLLIKHSLNFKDSGRKSLFEFLEVKKSDLIAADINISIPNKGRLKYKYAHALYQYEKLDARDKVQFDTMKKLFEVDQQEKEEEAIKKEEENYKNNIEMIAKLAEDRKKLLEDSDQNSPIDQMLDSKEKYEKIIKMYKNQGVKFTDTQFPKSEESLGSEKLQNKTKEWVRASERQDTVIFRDKINPRDIAQGVLGDCYFIAAISVLKVKDIKERIKFINSKDPDEKECGAFWVRFLKYGKPVDVIVDDYFPVSENGEFIFAKGAPEEDEDKPEINELWPMIIEKAYAKLNGSYHIIEGGKVQYALADMIRGASEQIELRNHREEKSKLWNRLRSLAAQGALLGAGSKDSIDGKQTVNSSGIVLSHAYAILGLKQFDGYRLLNLKNPHGIKGQEWNGDWSDDSHMWTQKSRSKCKSIIKDDGIFWIDFDDFFNHFNYLYIFRVMDDWNEYKMKG